MNDWFNIMETARRTILPEARVRLDCARSLFDLNTPREQQWSDSEEWMLAYLRHALILSGFYRDSSYEEPSRVLLVVPEAMDARVRMDLMFMVGIAPEFTNIKAEGKGAHAQLFAPSWMIAERWQDIADRCERTCGMDVAYTGIIRTWSDLQAPGGFVDKRLTYYLGDIDCDDLFTYTKADSAGLQKMLDTPGASCMLIHRENLKSLVPEILERSDVHVVTVLGDAINYLE